jgi:magnesium chelatase subunit I
VEWFDLGGSLQLSDNTRAEELLGHARDVQGLIELAHGAGIPKDASVPLLAAGVDFVLEGLYALKKISRSEDRGYHASDPPVRRPVAREPAFDANTPVPTGSGKKKYYN